MIASAARKADQKIRPIRRVVIRAGGVLLLTGAVATGLYFYTRKKRIEKWMRRMTEQDVAVAAYFVPLVGPKGLVAMLKAMLVEKAKSIPAIAILVKGYELITGDTLMAACEQGVDMSNDWDLVQEAYKGITNHELHKDLQKKLKPDEFQALMKRIRDRQQRRDNIVAVGNDTRRKYIDVVYKAMEKAPVGTVVTVRTATYDFTAITLVGYDKPTTGIKYPDKSKRKWDRDSIIGKWTRRLVKTDPHTVLMEVGTDFGPYWFKCESLTQKKP